MAPEIVVVPFIFGSAALTLIMSGWFRHKERMASLAKPPATTPALEARLERVEQAIEAIAVEMERVGEGQRFLTRILSERTASQPDALPARARVNTPH